MALNYPDILQHNNSNYALIDSAQLRGTAYVINSLSDTGSVPTDKRNPGSIIFATGSQQFYGFYGTSSVGWDTTTNWRLLSSGSTGTGGTGAGFPYSGSAVITGSLLVSGSGGINIIDPYLKIGIKTRPSFYNNCAKFDINNFIETGSTNPSIEVARIDSGYYGSSSYTAYNNTITSLTVRAYIEPSPGRTYNITPTNWDAQHAANWAILGIGVSGSNGAATIFNSGKELKTTNYGVLSRIDLWPELDQGSNLKTYNGWYAAYGGTIDSFGAVGTNVEQFMYYTAGGVKSITNTTINTMIGYYSAPLSSSNVTNAYAIYQSGSGDISYFQGKIGIGTAMPAEKLEVFGSLRVTENIVLSGSAGQLTVSTDTLTGIAQKTTDFNGAGGTIIGLGLGATTGNTYGTLAVRNYGGSGGANLIINQYGGNVGIGTSSPSNLFEVNGISAVVTPYGAFTALQASGSTGYRWSLNNDDSFRLQYTTNGFSLSSTTPMYISSSGNVGIGTTNPAAKLDVSGPTKFGSLLANPHQFTGSVSMTGSLAVIGTGTISTSLTTPLLIGGTTTTSTITYQPTSGVGTTGADHIFKVGNNGATEAMRILNSANVGIGTTPTGVNGKLQVSGSIGLSGNSEIRQATNSDGSTLKILATQLVVAPVNSQGYGYTENGVIASVSANDSVLLLDAGYTTSTFGRFKVANTISTNTSISLEKNSVTTLFASTIGNVGIGTSSPNAKLEVVGGSIFINQDQRLQWNVAGSATIRADIRGTSGNAIVFGNRVGGTLTDTMTLDGSGNLGIGTTNPAAKLDVAGEIIAGQGLVTSNLQGVTFNTASVGSVRLIGDNVGSGLDGGDYVLQTNPAYYGNVITNNYLAEGSLDAVFTKVGIGTGGLPTTGVALQVAGGSALVSSYFRIGVIPSRTTYATASMSDIVYVSNAAENTITTRPISKLYTNYYGSSSFTSYTSSYVGFSSRVALELAPGGTYNITPANNPYNNRHAAATFTNGLGISGSNGVLSTYNSGYTPSQANYAVLSNFDFAPDFDGGSNKKRYNGWYSVYGAYFDLPAGSGSNVETLIHYSTSGQKVFNPASSSITNLIGYYVAPLSQSGVTNPYSIYQSGSGDINYFEGKIGIGNLNPQYKLDVSGSLRVTGDFVVLGSASIQYVSASNLNVGTNLITVNTFNPTFQFGGLAAIDSGSSPLVSGSLLFDSVNDNWITVHKGTSTVTSSIVITGPESYSGLGSETRITNNRIVKASGDGGDHIADSQIVDDGTSVSITNSVNTALVKITNNQAGINGRGMDILSSGSSVISITNNGAGYGVLSNSKSGTALSGNATSGTGVNAQSDTGTALNVSTNTSTAIVAKFNTPSTEVIRIDNSGSLLLGTTVNDGYILNVNGSGKFTNKLVVSGSLLVTGSNTLIGTKTITGSVFISGSKTIIGNNTITGSLLVSASTIRFDLPSKANGYSLISDANGNATWQPVGTAAGFPFTGNATINGSLTVTGSVLASGSSFGVTGSLSVNGANVIRNIIEDPTVSTGLTGAGAVFPNVGLIRSYLIPANTFTSAGFLKIQTAMFQHQGLAGSGSCRLYINTSNTLTAATMIAERVFTAANQYINIGRTFSIIGGQITGWNANNDQAIDYNNHSNNLGAYTFNPAVNNYILVAGWLQTGTDTLLHRGLCITN